MFLGTNTYCFRCGKLIRATEKGAIRKVQPADFLRWPRLGKRTKYMAQHDDCAVKFDGTDVHHYHQPSGD